jgi:hypothetical protein
MELNFDLTPVTIPVIINNEQYTLKEPTAAAVAQYRNKIFASTQFAGTGKINRVSGLADVEPFLVSLCLGKVVKVLFKKAKELAELESPNDDENENKEDGADPQLGVEASSSEELNSTTPI